MYYLLGAQPPSPNRLPPRPGDVQLCQKNDGPAVLTRTRNTSNIRSTTQQGVGNTNRLCRIRIQYLDQRQHLGSNRLDVLQTGHPNEQRRGRLHNGLNRRASGRAQLPMYLLIQLLYREAKLTAIQIRLVSESSCDESSDESIGSYSREYLSCGTSTRPGKGQPDDYWRPALILMEQ